MTGPEIDLGHGHFLRYFRWEPDDLPENRAQYGVPLPCVEKAGAQVSHAKPDGSECFSGIYFDLPELRKHWGNDDRHYWQVQSWEPLTVSPSLLCTRCGDHGFIRDGKWVPA
jgi:hypothetical protein